MKSLVSLQSPCRLGGGRVAGRRGGGWGTKEASTGERFKGRDWEMAGRGTSGHKEVDWLHLLALKNLGSHPAPGASVSGSRPPPPLSNPLADLRRPADPHPLRPEVPALLSPSPEGKLGGRKVRRGIGEGGWGEEREERAG